MSSEKPGSKDWSSTQYSKFLAERTRPSYDLISQIPFSSPKTIVDLGCGPGNSTAVLFEKYPSAKITGMDSSPDMIKKARQTLPEVTFELGDLYSYRPSEPADVLFSNAVYHWIDPDKRIPLFKDLISTQKSGGVFAFQVPDNFEEVTHRSMREAALESDKPWASLLKDVVHKRENFQTPNELYDQLKPICSDVNIWRTAYFHVMQDHQAVVEWLKSTGLRPFLEPLDEQMQQDFMLAYRKRLEQGMPNLVDGKVLMRFPRLFVVCVKA